MRLLVMSILMVMLGSLSLAGCGKPSTSESTGEAGAGQEETETVEVQILTSGGAGCSANLNVTGAQSKDIPLTGKDTVIKVEGAKDASITGTVTHLNDVGEVAVTVKVDGQVVFRDVPHASKADKSVNIVL
jgi:hypothetical protein